MTYSISPQKENCYASIYNKKEPVKEAMYTCEGKAMQIKNMLNFT